MLFSQDYLSLAPLSRPKSVAYAVLLPSDLAAMGMRRKSLPVLNFFRELSHTYENCNLGKHYPYYRPNTNTPESAFISIPAHQGLCFRVCIT